MISLSRFGVLFLLAPFTAVGCSPAPGADAIDINLIQDLRLNTSDQVLDKIEVIQLIVDNDDGLYGEDDRRTSNNWEVRNADADAPLELVVTLPVTDGELPWIRLEQGGLPRGTFDLRVRGGMREDVELNPTAQGGVRGISFEDGTEKVDIPFNIRPDLLPPRVADVIPGNGSDAPGCRISDVVVLFSKPVSADSLDSEGTFDLGATGTISSISHDASGLIAHLKVLIDAEGLSTLTYQLDVSTLIVDEHGVALDEVATEKGAQPYHGEFTLMCSPPPTNPDNPDALCGPTNPQGTCQSGLTCREGVCVPGTCDHISCADPFVCNPNNQLCELDCRLYGFASICPASRPVCDPQTGLCVVI